MSGIAKPLVKFASSKTPTQVVGVDHIVNISKIDIPALPNQPGNTAQYGIQVDYIYPNSHTKSAQIFWTASAQRNTDFTSFETLVCATI
jgi:hypothetical protein